MGICASDLTQTPPPRTQADATTDPRPRDPDSSPLTSPHVPPVVLDLAAINGVALSDLWGTAQHSIA
jgi:hypothetical protein